MRFKKKCSWLNRKEREKRSRSDELNVCKKRGKLYANRLKNFVSRESCSVYVSWNSKRRRSALQLY